MNNKRITFEDKIYNTVERRKISIVGILELIEVVKLKLVVS